METACKTSIFVRFCASLEEHMDLRLSKEQKAGLVKECSEMKKYLRALLRLSFNAIMFVRFCISASVKIVDFGLSLEQKICLVKECIEMAKYYDDKTVMKYSILLFVRLNTSVCRYKGKEQLEDAIIYGKECIDIAKELGDLQKESHACYVVGKGYVGLRKYEHAVAYCKKCIEITRARGDKHAEMYACLELGQAHLGLGQHADAVAYFKKCIEITRVRDDKNAEMHAYLELGRAHVGLGQYADAIAYCKKCIEITKLRDDKHAEMHAYLELGRAHVGLGQYEDAIAYCTKCIEITKVTGDKHTKMCAYLELGKAYQELEEFEEAIFFCKKCTDIAKQIDSMQVEIEAYYVLQEAYARLKQYKDAILCSKKCISIAKETGAKTYEKDACFMLGCVYEKLKQYENAILFDEKCIEIAIETSDRRAEMAALFLLGEAYAGLKQYKNATSFYKKCIHIAKETGNKRNEMIAHLNIAGTLMHVPLLNDAFLHLSEGKTIADELKDDDAKKIFRSERHILYVIVGMYDHSFPNKEVLVKEFIDIPTSERDLVDALDKAMKTGDVNDQSMALLRVHCFCYSKQEYGKALKSLKQLKALMACSGTNLWCNINIIRLYILMRQNNKALEYCQEVLPEVSECRDEIQQSIFYSTMGQLLHRDGQWNSSEEYLREALRCFEIAFASLGDNDEFKISIFDRYIDCYKCLSIVLHHTNKVSEALLVSDRCRARALKDRLILNFGLKQQEVSCGEERNYTDIEVFVSSNKFSILFYSLFQNGTLIFSFDTEMILTCFFQPFEISEKDFLQFLNKAYDEMNVRLVVNCENRSLDSKQENSQKQKEDVQQSMFLTCTNSLLEINFSQQRMTGLYSTGETPDSNVNRIALERLYNALIGPVKDLLNQDEVVIIPDGLLNQVPFAALQDPGTGRYLIENKRIRLAPSITTLKVLQERPVDQQYKDALIIGDPLVGKVMMNGEETDVKRLNGALEEAVDIALILVVRPLLAREATKPAVIKKLQQGVSVVHIAAHGILSKASIVLAPSPEIRATKIPDEEDYMLTMADVQKAQVRAQLVVLSCCHSGRGEIRAEGVVGMCRAFLASGARAVVASLWAINDLATRKFMKKFYKHLKKGNSASTSLQLTMNDMRQSKKFSEPKYWAAFFLIGDDVTINFTK